MNTHSSQERKVYDVLNSTNPNGLTRMQVACCLGIERSSVCGRVDDLKRQGLIWVVKKGICPVTKHSAEFLTTNKMVAMSLPPSARAFKEKPEKTGELFKGE